MNPDEKLSRLLKTAKESAALRLAVADQLGKSILDLADLMSGVIGSGGKIMVAGNGGLATAASRFTSDLVVRLRPDRNRQALPAIALCVDSAVMTAAANDYGYENMFARQVEGIGRKGDMLLLLSGSGNSENLIRAAQTAREMKILCAAILGGDGGTLLTRVDHALLVPHNSPQRIQEEQVFIIHILVEMIEGDLFA
jgi:D-sedoheptulose 7-phosphate isomerase